MSTKMSFLKKNLDTLSINVERHKIIVGVDYGTTYSGVAFLSTKDQQTRAPKVLSGWPGAPNDYLEKVPSRIAYDSDLKAISWGYSVPPGVKSYCWTKLLLDEDTSATEYDDPSLREASGGAGLDLPHGKEAEDVATDYLTFLYQHTMERLSREVTAEILALTPIEFWFTMPAIWSDRAQHATKSAAERAGFGCRALDTIRMITEPEAAALAAFKSTNDSWDGVLQAGTGVLVCDCGGGTIDITTYTIRQDERGGNLRLEEASVGDGGKCGATYVDRNLFKMLDDRYGDAYNSLDVTRRGPGSAFMNTFETCKRNFEGPQSGDFTLQLIMRRLEKDDPRCVQYDVDDAEVTITAKDMQSLFDPVVKKIIRLVAKSVEAVKKRGEPAIRNLILVGGFGSSEYLWRKMRKWCEENGNILPISPERPWSAIARGAALRGFYGSMVTKRLCRRHYGTKISYRYRPGQEPDDDDVWEDPITKELWRDGWMVWQIQKGEVITQNTKKYLKFDQLFKKDHHEPYMMTLYSCRDDHAPSRIEKGVVEKVGQIKLDLSSVNISSLPSIQKKRRREKGHLFRYETHCRVDMKLEVAMTDKSGVLKFRALAQGKSCGSATIDFSKHD